MLLIYGAGYMGIRYARFLKENGIYVDGFIDKYKSGEVKIDEASYPIKNIENVEDFAIVIVSVLDIETRIEIERDLATYGLASIDIVDILYKNISEEEKRRRIVKDFHLTQFDDYFEAAEERKNLDIFWREESPFKYAFNQLDLSIVVELACGRGRHVENYIANAHRVILVDYQENNIKICRERFKEYDGVVNYYCNNGKDLSKINDESVTSVFSYDSVVHFEMLDIYNYLKEIYRVLRVGGKALIHHSNNTESYTVDFITGKCGRNYMSKDIFAYLAYRCGLYVISQTIIDWDVYKDLDCITLLEKKK